MWKCVIDTKDLKTYECTNNDLQVCIEARQNNSFWEIYKTYRAQNLTFTEEYEATNNEEATDIIKKMKTEIIDASTLEKIDKVRKNLAIKVKRVFKEHGVEKWKFSVNSEKFSNIVIIRYGKKEIEMDIIAHEQFRFIETEILDELFRILGLNDFELDIVQNVYFFSKKSSFFNDAESDTLMNRIEVGFNFESEGDDDTFNLDEF
ncbi:MAG: hypothetical protein ACOC32_00420 [Nanoarchaeota archaeon]